jgi:hypothetical protein
MPLLEIILTGIGLASSATDIRGYIKEKLDEGVQLEDLLAELIQEGFREQLPRLQHLCPAGTPMFHADTFAEELRNQDLQVSNGNDLRPVIMPILKECISTPGATCAETEFLPVYESILNYAITGMWRRISGYRAAVKVLLDQNEKVIEQQRIQEAHTQKGLSAVADSVISVDARTQEILEAVERLASYAQGVSHEPYDRLFDSAPPRHHTIAERVFINPFTMARAEDFNHNYGLLARLFQSSPEWDSIQQREVNVFIEGGRGTGKSMLLRRLTAQATLAHRRLIQPQATYDDISEEYFGVYVKLTRGYYDQFSSTNNVSVDVSALLAQHQLNIEIFDAFIDALKWLVTEGALPGVTQNSAPIVSDLTALFDRAPKAHTLDDFREIIRYEQDQITTYIREKAFGNEVTYQGSARDTVMFMRQMSEVFHKRLFPNRVMRLFLLIDEFESLIEVQQIALNTVMKMRLPDLSTKVAVRKAGRKTADTFTQGDPIQQPRDYTEVRLDYDVNDKAYKKLLHGIAEKRLVSTNYTVTTIESYLPKQPTNEEVPKERLEQELRMMWESGNRRSEEISEEFMRTSALAATYRVLAKSHQRKSFSGFDQYVLLSSGIISNFIELCKYTFYFALSQKLPLDATPAIPPYLQKEATYSVSQRLFSTIDGNVPRVGSLLSRLLSDLGAILRNRLLHHPSEPEANRLMIVDYSNLSDANNELLAQMIEEATVWSVLHVESPGESFRPKNSARPPNAEFIINRIYCPALDISPRARWRVKLRISDLLGLIDPSTRDTTYRKLMRNIGARKTTHQPSFFAGEEQA